MFDRSACENDPVILVRRSDGRLEVASTNDRSAVQAAVVQASESKRRVYHLLDVSKGDMNGMGSGAAYSRQFTLVTSCPHDKVITAAKEAKKKTVDFRPGAAFAQQVLHAPESTVAEMVKVGQLKGLTKERVEHIADRYGPVLRRLTDCGTANDASNMDKTLRQAASAWVLKEKATLTSFGIPNIDQIAAAVSDVLVIRVSRYDGDGGDGDGDDDSQRLSKRFELAPAFKSLRWASRYVRSLICDAIFKGAYEALFKLALDKSTAHDMRGRLAEDLMLKLFEVGATTQAVHTQIKRVSGGTLDAPCNLVPELGPCAVHWMYTGDEKRTFSKVLAAGKDALIRPYAHCYAGIDAILVFRVDAGFAVLALQATVATSHPLGKGGQTVLRKWMALCRASSTAWFHGLVFLVPPHLYPKWGLQTGVPRTVLQMAWTLASTQRAAPATATAEAKAEAKAKAPAKAKAKAAAAS